MNGLADWMLADLRGSGLSDQSIADYGFRGELDPHALQRLLNWKYPARDLGHCLVIPYPKIDGSGFNCFARVKPQFRRPGAGKYEQPANTKSHAYYTWSFTRALKDPQARKLVIIPEGEKKTIAIEQCGYSAIGVSGIWNGFQTRQKDGQGKGIGERLLLPELAAIDWRPWTVVILFDTDSRRNPDVNHARAEFARVLSNNYGAKKVVLVDLPIGPIGDDGLPKKTGPDDFILRCSREALEYIIERAIAPAAPRTLESYRRDIQRARIDSIGKPGIYIDRSQTGAGKSHSGRKAAKKAKRSLMIVPSHKLCEEEADAMIADNMDAAAYPKLGPETCENLDEALQAIKSGLAVLSAVCPTCQHRDGCDYHELMKEADVAAHRICTHARASTGSLAKLARETPYIEIHEDAKDLVGPTVEVSTGLTEVATIADKARLSEMYDYVSAHIWTRQPFAMRWSKSPKDYSNDWVLPRQTSFCHFLIMPPCHATSMQFCIGL